MGRVCQILGKPYEEVQHDIAERNNLGKRWINRGTHLACIFSAWLPENSLKYIKYSCVVFIQAYEKSACAICIPDLISASLKSCPKNGRKHINRRTDIWLTWKCCRSKRSALNLQNIIKVYAYWHAERAHRNGKSSFGGVISGCNRGYNRLHFYSILQ